MPATTAVERQAAIQQGELLLSKKVYSVAELEDSRKKAKTFIERARSITGAAAVAPAASDPSQDLLDWFALEKAAVQLVQDALAKDA